MREALGLGGDGAPDLRQQRQSPDRRPRRFVKDGEVPVVILSTTRGSSMGPPMPVNRVATAEAALRSERTAREQAQRSLHEALATIEHLRTQLGHAALAHREALAGERRERERAERALEESEARRAALEAQLAEAIAMPAAEPPAIRESNPAVVERAELRPQRKPKPAPEAAAEPVQWWLPDFKAKPRKR